MMICCGKSRVLAASLCAVLIVGYGGTAKVSSDPAETKREHSRVPFSHILPHLDGARLEAAVLEVNYGPGETSPPHAHPCAVMPEASNDVLYILDGIENSPNKRSKKRALVTGERLAIFYAYDSASLGGCGLFWSLGRIRG